MKKICALSVFVLFFGFQSVNAQVPDSCLKLLMSGTADSTWANPDSVKVDSCSGSTTFGEKYAKGWFRVEFSYYILPTPIGPRDTIIDRTWHDIDTQYSS